MNNWTITLNYCGQFSLTIYEKYRQFPFAIYFYWKSKKKNTKAFTYARITKRYKRWTLYRVGMNLRERDGRQADRIPVIKRKKEVEEWLVLSCLARLFRVEVVLCQATLRVVLWCSNKLAEWSKVLNFSFYSEIMDPRRGERAVIEERREIKSWRGWRAWRRGCERQHFDENVKREYRAEIDSTVDSLHERSILLRTFFFPFVLTRPRITVLLNSAFSVDQENGGINGILKRAWMFVSPVFVYS